MNGPLLLHASQRHLFDIPRQVAYFNCAYNAPLLKASAVRLHEGVESKCRPWERTAPDFFADAETLRTLASRLFGGNPNDYAVVPAASYGLSTAARALEPTLAPGDVILLMAEEFPSNVLPWRRTADNRRASVEVVLRPADGDWTRALLDRIRAGIRVVAVSSCHWTNGARIDLAAIGAACRAVGSALVVDATQSLGAVPLSVDEVRPDFLVAAGYKWLLCPYGFGLLYVSERWQQARPLEESWLARTGAEDFAGLIHPSDEYLPGARRFDMGEKCIPTLLPGAIAALEQIARWGVAHIAESLSVLNAVLERELLARGFEVVPEASRMPNILAARLPDGRRSNMAAALKARDVYVSQRGDWLRFAPHLHIDAGDVEHVLDALDAQLAKAP